MRTLLFLCGLLAAMPLRANPLSEAFEAAWRRHPAAASEEARSVEHAARQRAAQSRLAEPPRAVVGIKAARSGPDAGGREVEAEVEFPIALPGLRNARISAAELDLQAFMAQLALEKWRLAGEVREAYWAWAFAENDVALAERRAEDAAALAADVRRRHNVGEVARTDLNLATVARNVAQSSAAEAKLKASRASMALRALTGLPVARIEAEAPTKALSESHPQALATRGELAAADARYRVAIADRHDPPEVSLGTAQDRSPFGDRTGSLLFKVKIPFPSEARNAPRIAQANAERIEAQARLAREESGLATQLMSAAEAVAFATSQIETHAMRVALATENRDLVGKAYRLGEIDLTARLRAETDYHEAAVALARARLEHGQSISRYRQAVGSLP